MRRVALLAAFVLFGCETEPYCLSCMDGGSSEDGGMDATVDGAAVDGRVDAPVDAGRPDGCLAMEICNDLDDDCDGLVDEDFDLDRNPLHCGECDLRCNPPHAFPRCEDGTCTRGDCDIGFYDLNMDPTDGCEYRCSGMETDDRVCDLRDDDCDGMIDEDVDLDGDPVNCGRCGRVCNAPHSTAGCTMGVCALASCDVGFHDLDDRADNGCEYTCTAAVPPVEVCNLRDDDCDGMIDEGDPGGGASCGSAVGACRAGTTSCVRGRLECVGEVVPTAELCNGADDDCDGMIDEGDPDGGRVCGTSTGICESGIQTCMGGGLVCVGGVSGSMELCNGLDDDCDGMIDESNPEGGGACGSTVGECTAGMWTCSGGVLVCMGGVVPSPETCDGTDEDCNGMIDDGSPGGGALCGTDVGTCSPGSTVCSGGMLVCVGAIGPGTETCNGQDDDCDGTIDEGNPDGGAPCGSTVGACTAGAMTCRGGSLVCEGGTGPRAELCNTLDDDCDGSVDEDFALMTDVNNCGSCGNVCMLPNAIERCILGICNIAACERGFVDLDPGIPGCEYMCSFSGGEICNGLDDDCDGLTDELLVPPVGYCNPNGVCGGTTASCSGLLGWTCAYGPTYETPETACDSLDNDCDGMVDEVYAELGTTCRNGLGTCQTTGTYICNAAGDGTICTAPPAGVPGDEECNGLDDDCDGTVDERVVDDPMTAWRDGVDVNAIDTVTVDLGGTTMEMMAYEASRPDATSVAGGSLEHIACSHPNVVPWVNVTWDEAQAACCALNPSGTCPGMGGSGWRLCEALDWQRGCTGPVDVCTHSYATMCTTSQRTTCNGAEHDCDLGTPGDQDCLYTTGSPTFPMCSTDWGAAGSIYDLSGNVREWTATSRGPGLFEVRGGSMNHIEPGRSCQWSFTVAQRTTAAPNTGFRCCLY